MSRNCAAQGRANDHGSSGRIRTYDQSVNPDSVGTRPLSYAFLWTSRSRIKRADFQFLISRSHRIALERSGCSSEHTKAHGPFLRVICQQSCRFDCDLEFDFQDCPCDRCRNFRLDFEECTPRTWKMAPEVGFEPTTNRLTADRSTTELLWIAMRSIERR
jgi:hypothetical protein